MNCVIIEDQPPAQRLLKRYINDLGNLELKATFPDALQALEYLQNEVVDLLFLDIHLPKLSGLDFLKTLSNPPQIILTTAFPDYALESYELGVVDYLLKPFSFQRFVQAVGKANKSEKPLIAEREMLAASDLRATIFVKSGHAHLRVNVQDILFIKSDGDYTEIYMTNNEKHLSSESLRYWLDKLKLNKFHQIHKSYLINTAHVKKIMGGQVYLSEKVKLPLGRVYKERFLNIMID